MEKNMKKNVYMYCMLCVCVLAAQAYPTLCDPMDCSPSGSSVHGILQTRIWSGLPLPSPNLYVCIYLYTHTHIYIYLYMTDIAVEQKLTQYCK